MFVCNACCLQGFRLEKARCVCRVVHVSFASEILVHSPEAVGTVRTINIPEHVIPVQGSRVHGELCPS